MNRRLYVMKKKVVAMLLAGIMAAGVLAGCGGSSDSGQGGSGNTEEGKVINIYTWNDEFRTRVEAVYPEVEETSADGTVTTLKDGTEIHWIVNPNQDGVYQQKLDEALMNQADAAADDKVDIFLSETDYVYKYTDAEADVAMPLTDLGIDPEKDLADQYEFLATIKERDDVNAVMGLFSMLPEETAEGIVNLVNDEQLAGLMSSSGMDMSMITGFLNNGYTMYSVMLDADPESAEGSVALGEIRTLLDNTFGKDGYYITGMTQAVSDLQDITPTDFLVVSLVSIAIIFVILLLTLRSFKMSVIVILVIEFGIFVNLSISYIFGQTVNFMAYIILSSIQLGATVDYAILYTVKYQNYLGLRSAREAAYTALTESGVSIMTSVAILAGCCLSVSIITTNIIVSEITLMIARGSIISGILVMLLLPALLIISTGNQKLEKRSIRKLQNKLFRREYKEKNAQKEN